MLNEHGGFESDLTVTRLAEYVYLVVTGAAQTTRDFHWIKSHCPDGARATLTDVTGSYAVLGVMGPRARDLLARLTSADLSNAAFPFATSQEIWLGRSRVRASRITYVGELGWELYVPTEFAAETYDALQEAGADLGLRDAGYYALESLRLEKAYRAWGRELTTDDTPLEAGLGFAVRFDKATSFIGRDALLAQKGAPLTKRLITFVLDDPMAFPLGDEPIWSDGRIVGSTTSAAFGHSLGRAVAMGYVRRAEGVGADYLRDARFEIEIGADRAAAGATLRAPYDPEGLRIKI
jgi:heterotetrameric sarcosine oxidase gamma subunit